MIIVNTVRYHNFLEITSSYICADTSFLRLLLLTGCSICLPHQHLFLYQFLYIQVAASLFLLPCYQIFHSFQENHIYQDRKMCAVGGGGGLTSAALDSPPGPERARVCTVEHNFCQQPVGPVCLARCGAQPRTSPPRGTGARAVLLPTRGHPGAHPSRPPASSPWGPEGATGQRSPGSGPGWVGEALFFPALAALGVPQRPLRLWRHQLLRGCGAAGPALWGAPRRRGGVRGGLRA